MGEKLDEDEWMTGKVIPELFFFFDFLYIPTADVMRLQLRGVGQAR
jgi:hypothetical protein